MARTPPGQTREKVFRFVSRRLLAGTPPTLREIQQALGFRSVESARSHLNALVKEGRLIKQAGKARGYQLARQGRAGAMRPPMLVPLLGQVQAGALTEAIQEPEGYLAVQGAPTSGELFALRVRGESMVGIGMLPGDIAIVRRQPRADSGDVVVALVTGLIDEATVKTLKRRRGRWVLQPENPEFDPIVPEAGTLQVLGKVIEVRRKLE